MSAPIRGGVYLVADEAVSLDDGQSRSVHDERRPFVVLSDLRFNRDPNWQVVLGCPASSSTQFRTELCVRLAAGEANVPKKCWIRVPALQAIPKAALQDRTGILTADKLREAQMRVLEYLGLIVPADGRSEQ